MKLISPTEYIADASALIRQATSRVYLLAMVIADHKNTHELIIELEEAAKRGVEVVVAADVFTFGSVISDYIPGKYKSKDLKQAQRMALVLKKSGVTFSWLGNRRATFLNARTHNKWCVVDDVVYSFGGVNIYSKGVKNVDYMFKLTDRALADRLVAEQLRIQKAEKRLENYPSVAHEHGDDIVLFDGGMTGQSIIYRRACELAEEANGVLYVSQYCPTGRLGRALRHKGDKARVYFNPPKNADAFNRTMIFTSMLESRLKTLYQRKTYLHAKFMIFTFADGSKKAITGSHNFAYPLVLLGNREVALETDDPQVISQLETFAKNEVMRSRD